MKQFMHRSTRQQTLVQKRKEREENSYNGRRKERYSEMSFNGELGRKELEKYFTMYNAIMNSSLWNDCHLPSENPTKIDYNHANRLYARLN